MTSTIMNTHQAFKALQRAGIDEQQAEAMVEIFTDMQQGKPDQPDDKQLSRVEQKVDQVDERLGHIERKIDKLGIRLNQIEIKVDKLEAGLVSSTRTVENLRDEVVTVKNDMRWIKRLLMVVTTTLCWWRP
ncbi:hypothetical protein FD733_07555 [Pantoea sp. Eser]|nr:hypothetical protein [Pantoea sp. Eser]